MKKKIYILGGLLIFALVSAVVYQGVQLAITENSSNAYEPVSKRRALEQQANNLAVVQQEPGTTTITVPPPAKTLTTPTSGTTAAVTTATPPAVLGVNSLFSMNAPVLECVNGKYTAQLSWGALANATAYTVERKVTGSSDATWEALSGRLPATTLSFTHSNVAAGSWSYQIHGFVGKKNMYTDEITVQGRTCTSTATTPPPAPVTPPPAPAPTPAPAPAAPPTSSGKLLWGAYNGWGAAAISDFEKLVGRSANIQAVFVGWGNNGEFPDYASTLKSQGKTLLIFWEPSNGDTGNVNQPDYNYDSITSGKWDSYLTSFAADAKAYGGPVILVPFEEMNGDWYPWSGTKNNNSQAKEIAAFKYLRKYFPAGGNVKIAWAPNSTSWPNTTANNIAGYYPGSENVDIVALDGFNFNNPWETFSQVFDKALAVVKPYGKPLYIVSMASCQGSNKPAWITDALTVQMPKNGITGFVWFNTNKECDWRVNSDAATLAAFKAALP